MQAKRVGGQANTHTRATTLGSNVPPRTNKPRRLRASTTINLAQYPPVPPNTHSHPQPCRPRKRNIRPPAKSPPPPCKLPGSAAAQPPCPRHAAPPAAPHASTTLLAPPASRYLLPLPPAATLTTWRTPSLLARGGRSEKKPRRKRRKKDPSKPRGRLSAYMVSPDTRNPQRWLPLLARSPQSLLPQWPLENWQPGTPSCPNANVLLRRINPGSDSDAVRLYLQYFGQTLRPALRQQHPEASVTELAKLIGQKWRELSDDGALCSVLPFVSATIVFSIRWLATSAIPRSSCGTSPLLSLLPALTLASTLPPPGAQTRSPTRTLPSRTRSGTAARWRTTCQPPATSARRSGTRGTLAKLGLPFLFCMLGPGADTVSCNRRRRNADQPKKPLSAFFLYSAKRRPDLKEKNPQMKLGDVGSSAPKPKLLSQLVPVQVCSAAD